MVRKLNFNPFNLDEEGTYTTVLLKNYRINQTVLRDTDIEESQLTLELTFLSDNVTPKKFSKFLKEFDEFLVSRGYQEGIRD